MLNKGVEAFLNEEMDGAIFEGFEGALHDMMKLSQWADDVKLMQEAGRLAEQFHTMFKNFGNCVALRDSTTDASTIEAAHSITHLHALLESLDAWRVAYSNPALQHLGDRACDRDACIENCKCFGFGDKMRYGCSCFVSER